MKNYFVFLLLSIVLFQAKAQKHEVGVFLGGTNGITDIGRSDYVNPLPYKSRGSSLPNIPFNLGVIYKYNLNPQQSLRANLHYANFFGDDRFAIEDYRKNRGLEYSQNLYEASVLFEYNFFPINSEQESAHSPYIFAGLGVFGYEHPLYNVRNVVDANNPNVLRKEVSVREEELKFSYTIPFGVGYKYKFAYNWIVGLEVGVRPTFIDDLDKGYAKKEDFRTENGEEVDAEIVVNHQIGDVSNRDWYVFTGITLTYNFGRMPCFCD